MANREEERKQKWSEFLCSLSRESDSSSHTRLHEFNLWGSQDFPEALGHGGNQGDSLEISGDRRLEGERPSVSLGAGAPCVPRLGWCDGLANYEKKKVGPNVRGNKNGAPCVTSKLPSQGKKGGTVISDSNIDPHFPRDAAFSDCAVAVGIDGPGTATQSLDSISLVKRSNLSVELNAPKPFASNQEDAVVSSCMEKRLPLQNINHGAQVSSLHVLADQEQTYKAILAENMIASRKASEVFQKQMPSEKCDLRDVDSVIKSISANLESSMNDPVIRARFTKRQRFLRFKERVIAIKFRALQHCWKKSKRNVLSLKRACSRASASSAGNPNTVPDADTIKFVRKLLLNPNVQPCRDFLKMPSMILDKNLPRFISSNGLVEDPVSVEKERLMINPWTAEEKEIFMDKLSVFKDDFTRIAVFLDHKTTADCVDFYYKNCNPGKQNTPFSSYRYLAVSGKRWNREAFGSQHMYLVDDDLIENLRPTEFDICGNEVETRQILKLLLHVLERDLEISVGVSLAKLGNGLRLLHMMNPETENVWISAH